MTEVEGLALEELVKEMSAHLGTGVLVGVDRVEIGEFRRIVGAGGEPFLTAVYTTRELQHCKGRTERLASRFAAKEATTKALGTGIRGVSLHDIEIITSPEGQPHLRVVGRAQYRADELGVVTFSVSLTHTSASAEAFVVALTRPSTTNPPTSRRRCCD